MSTEDNKALVRRFFEQGFKEAAQGNLTHLHEYFADHFHDHTSLHHTDSGLDAVKEMAADTDQAAGDFQFEIRHMAAEGDLVFTHYQFVGTHSGQYQVVKHVKDLEPVDEEERVSGIVLFRLEGGKIAEAWNYHNILEYAQQRGASPPAGPAGK